jgi:menaquinone-specific isochorismate synthase
VGGNPLAQALEYIASAEPFDRGLYAGAVGWMDARGDGDWAVGIRCAQVSGQVARLVAGVGVVADSVPEAELAETQLKLQALLAAVVRP